MITRQVNSRAPRSRPGLIARALIAGATLLFTLPGHAAVVDLTGPVASILGGGSITDSAGTLIDDAFGDDSPPTALSLFGDAGASSTAGSSALASAFADVGVLVSETEVFDADEFAAADAFADFNAVFDASGVVALVVDISHVAEVAGADAATSTEIAILVQDQFGVSLVDELLSFTGGDDRQLSVLREFTLSGAGSLGIFVASESQSLLSGLATSLTSVEFRLEQAAVQVAAPGTFALLAGVLLLGSRRTASA